MLDAAADGLQRGCPTALAVTLDAIDRLAARRGDRGPRGSALRAARGARGERARLGGAPDFAEGVACVVGARRGERPKWSNDGYRCCAVDVAWTIRAWATSSRARGGNLMLNDKLFTRGGDDIAQPADTSTSVEPMVVRVRAGGNSSARSSLS